MNMYFNPGNESFICNAEHKYYVDKTNLIYHINDFVQAPIRCIAVSHARHFGKTQAAQMLCAYYSCSCDSRFIFKKFKLSKNSDWDKYLNKFNVIYVNIANFYRMYKDKFIDYFVSDLFKEIKNQYPDIDYTQSMKSVLRDVYKESKTRFVIILDEYDYIIREHKNKNKNNIIHKYMNFLYTIFKSAEANNFLALGYITGIFPIKNMQDESGVNNFTEYTMLDSGQIAQFFGFTESETEMLCKKYSMDFKEVKKWYNGYLINEKHMYNPNSICQCIDMHEFKQYLEDKSLFKIINIYIERNFYGLQEDILRIFAGECVFVDIETFTNDINCISTNDDVLTALLHLGYLSYDENNKKAFLPNYEVAIAYRTALKKIEWKKSDFVVRCEEILQGTIDKNNII